MKMNRRLKSILFSGLVILGCIGASVGTVYASTSILDVTVSTNPNASSPDPNSSRTTKSNGNDTYSILLNRLTGTNTIYFVPYRVNTSSQCGETAEISSTGQRHYFSYYSGQAVYGESYYVHGYSIEVHYSTARAQGEYTP